MSGHSKWSTIKHKKAAADAKKGRIFTKLVKELTIAARMGGSDPDANPRLRQAIATARDASMPSDNIDRAIKKGAGELDGVSYEDCIYEGYGPSGVAVLVEVTTDNRNRTGSEVRSIFSKGGGSLGAPGSVSWMFDKRGMFVFEKDGIDEEALMEAALEVGADDIQEEEEGFVVYCDPSEYLNVREAFEARELKFQMAQLAMIPKNTVKVAGKDVETIERLMQKIEECDDVQNVYSNYETDDE